MAFRRPGFVRFAVSIVALAFCAACGGDAPSPDAPREVNLLIWSEYLPPELVAEFEARNGARLRISYYESTEEMIAKLQHAGGDAQFDVVVAPNQSVRTMARLGLIRPLDRALLSNLDNLSPRFRDPDFDPGCEHSVPYQWGTVGVVWDRAKLPDFRPTWAAFFDPAARPGDAKFLLIDEARDALGAALLHIGQSPNATAPDLVARAADLVLDAKRDDRCLGFDGGVGAIGQVIGGAAAFAIAWNGDALRLAADAGAEDRVAFAVPEEGGMVWVDCMTVPAKAPNPEGGHAFANFILEAEAGAKLSEFTRYATPNARALELLPEEIRANETIHPGEDASARLHFTLDLETRSEAFDKAWARVKTE